jgi:hypothetical protein
MRRSNVRRVHVLRCALYCCDAGLLVGIVAGVLYVAIALGRFETLSLLALICGVETAVLTVASVVMALLVACRLAYTYALYLRFPHAVATAALSQVVVFLLGWIFAAVVWGLRD